MAVEHSENYVSFHLRHISSFPWWNVEQLGSASLMSQNVQNGHTTFGLHQPSTTATTTSTMLQWTPNKKIDACNDMQWWVRDNYFIAVPGIGTVGRVVSYKTLKTHCFFKKWANPGLFYHLFSVFSSKHHYNFYNKLMSI